MAVEVASRRLLQDANPAEDGGQLQSQQDEDDNAEWQGDVTAAVRAPSTDALHAGAECGLTTSEARSVLPAVGHLLSSWLAAGGSLEQRSVEEFAGHRTTTWSHPVVCCR